MKRALIDTSSAILLAKAGLIFKVARYYKIKMVPQVFEEITPDRRPFAGLFKRAMDKGYIQLVQPSESFPDSRSGCDTALNRLHDGERHTLLRYFEKREDFIIIDDGKGAGYCRANKIPYLNALLCPKVLFFAGHLNQQEYERFFRRLLKTGRYAAWVVDTAVALTQEELTDFLL